MRQLVTAAVFLAASACLFGDTVTLRNGQTYQGTFLGGTTRDIRLDLGDHVQTFAIGDVSAIQFDSGAPAPVPAPPPPSDPNAYSQPPGYTNNPPPNSPPSGGVGVTIPAGTQITVKMIDAVDSDSSSLGRIYRASLDEPIVVNGQTVIPRGADVTTKVVEDRQSGKIQGQTAVSLALQTVTVNGTPVDVTSQQVTEASSSRGARSTKVIGGTSALGAIIGAVAGGGKGAAIGAASGAAVGTGAQVLTHGQRVKIPSESRLTFTLTYPINI